MKSLKTSTACSSSLTTDVCKENKERHTTNKPSICYGKKEKSTMVSMNRKKGKVLCDVIASTSTAPLIPTKRQKVVINKKFSVGDKAETKDPTLELGMNTIDAIASTSNTTVPTSDDLSALIDQPTTSFDPDIPCCSYQILPQSSSFNPFKYPNAPKKSGNFLRKSSASTSSILLSQSTIVQATKMKGSAIKLRGAFNSASSSSGGTLLKSLRKSNLTKDGRRMKKKKLLKADAGLKRKKSKVF